MHWRFVWKYSERHIRGTDCGLRNFAWNLKKIEGRDRSVGIRKGYGMDGSGIELRWGARFSPPVRPDLLRTLWNGYRVYFQVVKPRGVALIIHSSCSDVIKQTVELYIYSTSGPSWKFLGWILTLSRKYKVTFFGGNSMQEDEIISPQNIFHWMMTTEKAWCLCTEDLLFSD